MRKVGSFIVVFRYEWLGVALKQQFYSWTDLRKHCHSQCRMARQLDRCLLSSRIEKNIFKRIITEDLSYFLQRDSTFAKKLFSVLFRGIFSQIEKKLSVPEAANVASDINTAVNNMVSSSTKFFPAFISSIQVCYFYSLLLTLVSIVIVNSGFQWKRQNYDCRILWPGK